MFLKASRFFLYLAPFAVVVVLSSTFFPFIGGKYYFFRVAVELSLVFFVLWWAFEASPGETSARLREVVSKPLFLAVSVFVLVFLLASIFARDPNGAFWSNYERGEGGFQMIHYYLFFVLLITHLKTWKEWRTLFFVSLAAAIFMILYGVLGYIGLINPNLFCIQGGPSSQARQCVSFITAYQGGGVPQGFWRVLTEARFQGSLGNPAYVAPYLMFAMFYAFYLWARGPGAAHRWGRRLFYGLLAVAYFFFFMVSQTRGAFLGLGAAVFAFFVYLIFLKPALRKWLIGGLAFLILFVGAMSYFRESSLVKSLPGSRLFNLAFLDQTVQTRLWTWGSAWQGFKERPLLGWGPENFSAVFDKHFDPRHYVPGTNSETWFDRAHSVVFDYLAETGILGLTSYLGIFVIFYVEFFHRYIRRKLARGGGNSVPQRSPPGGSEVLDGLLVALPIGYLVQGLALFDVLPIYINLFIFFAFSSHLFYESNGARN